MNEDFFDRVFEFEKENKVFDLKIENIYFWVLIRKRVFDNIQIKNGMKDKHDYTVSDSVVKNFFSVIRYVISALVNKLKPLKQAEYLIINHPRKIKYNGEYIDPNTYHFKKKFNKEKKSFLVLDVPLNWGRHLIKIDKNTRRIENFTILKKIYIKYLSKNKLLNNSLLLDLSNKLESEFGSNGNLIGEVYEQLNIFKIDNKFYEKFLTKIKPKRIYVVVSPAHFGLIAAAHELGIEVEEIQHGLISTSHLTYSFPNNDYIHYYPDRMSLYGEFWYDTTPLPVKRENISFFENKFLYDNVKQKKPDSKSKILFITQGYVTSKMIPIISDFCKSTNNKNYKTIIKLHPSEYGVWRKIYPTLNTVIQKYNVEIIDNFNKRLYDLFNECSHVVGVSSTALYEALCFGCHVHLLNLPTIENMEPLIKTNDVTLSDNSIELEKNINNINRNKGNVNDIDFSYYFYKESGGNKNE